MGNAKYQRFKHWQDGLIFFLLFSFSPFYLKGQQAQFSFNKITVADNLTSQIDNNYIFCDSENFLWISSTMGLNRFDGKKVKTYLHDENIQSMFFEDNQGRVWFSSYTGIFCYEREFDNFKVYHLKDEETGKDIVENYQLLYVDTVENFLWVYAGSEKNLYKFNLFDSEQIAFNIQAFNSKSEIKRIKDGSGLIILIPTFSGLRISTFPQNSKTGIFKTILQGYNISSVYLESDTLLWIGVDAALIQYNLEVDEIKRTFYFDKNQFPSIRRIVDPGNGKLIISTPENGIFIIDKKNGEIVDQIYSFKDGELTPFVNPITQIHLDPNNNLWIASYGNGIFFINLDKPKIKRYLQKSEKNKDANNNIKAITEDSKGQLYCLTENNIEVFGENGVVFQIDRPKNLPQDATLFSLFCNENDNLWLFSNFGLMVKQPSQPEFEILSTANNDEPISMIRASQLADSTLLMCAYNSGLYEIKEKGGRFFLEKYAKLGKTSGAYTLSFEDSKRRLYLCHEQRNILIYDNDGNNYIPIDTISFQGLVTGFVEDSKRGIIWLASQIGLYQLRLQENNRFSFQKDTIFPAKGVNGILMDSLNHLWVSTTIGLYRYFLHSNPDSTLIRKYAVADGLQSSEFTFWSALKTKSGKFAFGGVNGLNIFKPFEIKDLEIKPNPTITYIEINNEPFPHYLIDENSKATNVSRLKKINLSYDQNDLSIEMAALEYSDPSANEYYFQITDGKDTIVEKGKTNVFRYPNMQPGTYLLTYNTSNSDGVWFENLAQQLQIVVHPPWWKTLWARTLFFLAGLGFIYGYYRYRIAQIRKEEEFKRKEAEFKQKEAEYKQLVAETETAVLRLQMNPHFIFNSMNSINSYILQKDVDTASDYLNRFAKLMRMILKFAAKPLIAISDEIELLELYLQTEAMRFDKKFDYSFELKDDLDPDEFVIPTMILQPFVENAIWHGLSNKKEGEGQIKISFWQEDESFFCSVEDNGAGRANSNQNAKTHESKALSITAHRLQLLGKKNGVEASFKIEDLTDDNQKPSGTKVVLRFPLL